MFKPLPLFIGLRYARARRGQKFIAFISLFSLVGVLLGVVALITVLSVMNGFEQDLKTRILGVVPQAIVTSDNTGVGRLSAEQWPALADSLRSQLETQDASIGVAPLVRSRAMVQSESTLSGAQLFGVDPKFESDVSVVPEHMVYGSLENLQPGRYGVVIGRQLAIQLGVHVGDKILVMVNQGAAFTPFGRLPSQRRFTVVGLFEMASILDQSLALVHQEDAAKLLRMPGQISGLRVSSADAFQTVDLTRAALEQIQLGQVHTGQSNGEQQSAVHVEDWREEYGTLFAAVGMEKKLMGLMLVLVVAVAAFNIVAALVMVVHEKRVDVAILRTMGLTTPNVMTIFFCQGMYNGLVGSLLGTGIGLWLASNINTLMPWLERMFGLRILGGSELPVLIIPSQVAAISLFALALSFVATLYPAWRATRISPVDALRYE